MKLLAIETASLAGGVALMDENRLISEFRLHVNIRHAERVMTSIHHLLMQSQTTVSALDAIAVSIGPGSFTGLRVGLATAKGLAVGAGKPLVMVPTLEVMATPFLHARPLIAPFIDARQSEVYWTLFDTEKGRLVRKHEDAAASPELAVQTICRLAGEDSRGVLFVGDGALKYRKQILEKMPGRAVFPTRALQFPSAAGLADLGLEKFLKGEITPPDLAAPVYLRASAAELKRAERLAEAEKGGA